MSLQIDHGQCMLGKKDQERLFFLHCLTNMSIFISALSKAYYQEQYTYGSAVYGHIHVDIGRIRCIYKFAFLRTRSHTHTHTQAHLYR